MVKPPYRVLGPFDTATHRALRRRMMFDWFKWDPQVGDACTIGHFGVALEAEAWREIAREAEALAAETEAAEHELMDRPDLHAELGLPPAIRRLLARRAGIPPSPAAARVIRFDFHYTAQGWRISEANSDVPGGFNEAEGLARHVAGLHPGLRVCGEPGVALARAISEATDPAAGVVALVHATAYTDDRQVMLHLARALTAEGRDSALAAPDHLHRCPGGLLLNGARPPRRVAAAIRFFPGEWLTGLDRRAEWDFWFRGAPVGLCNPGSALLTQSKRFPLVWDRLRAPLAAWRRRLPLTRDPRDVEGAPERWVVKPAFGRVGEDIAMAGATPAKNDAAIRRASRRWPREWIAQERFDAIPIEVEGTDWTVCFGVYTVNGRAAGVYGRAAPSPLIASTACDVAVLTEPPCPNTGTAP